MALLALIVICKQGTALPHVIIIAKVLAFVCCAEAYELLWQEWALLAAARSISSFLLAFLAFTMVSLAAFT